MRGGVLRYAAQENPQIDTEIAKKRLFRMETNSTLKYTYDSAGRLIQVKYSSVVVIEYSYDSAGNILRRTLSLESPGMYFPYYRQGGQTSIGIAVSNYSSNPVELQFTIFTSGEGIVGFEMIQLQNVPTVIGLNAGRNNPGLESYSAQMASIEGSWFTNVKLVNTSEQTREVTLTAVDDQGEIMGSVYNQTLQPGAMIESDVAPLVQLESQSATAGTQRATVVVGSLKIVASGTGVIGDVIFGDPVHLQYAASLPLQTQKFKQQRCPRQSRIEFHRPSGPA